MTQTQSTLLAKIRERGGMRSQQMSTVQIRDAKVLVTLGYLVQRGPSVKCKYCVVDAVQLVSSN